MTGFCIYVHGQGDMWCHDLHVCFPGLPPVLECGFKSWLRLEFSGFSMGHFLKFVIGGFSLGSPVSSHL